MSLSTTGATIKMRIRRPASEVYEAFVDPAVTTRFWFSRSSGPLVEGARVTWEWECAGASAPVHVLALEPGRRISIEWGDPPRPVDWSFAQRPDGSTWVEIRERGFRGSADEIAAQAIDSTGGFTSVLAALKALLEHDIELNLVEDSRPDR